jgi:hypothetical protein
MGVIGVFMSMSQTDPDVTRRQAPLLAGLANEGITPFNTNIQYAWAFDNNGSPQYTTEAKRLVGLVKAQFPPGALFASCYPTMSALTTYTNQIPIIYAGLFHDGAGANPNSGFGNNVGGIYSHVYQVCAKWVRLLKNTLPNYL